MCQRLAPTLLSLQLLTILKQLSNVAAGIGNVNDVPWKLGDGRRGGEQSQRRQTDRKDE
jgi:hypothetical protein